MQMEEWKQFNQYNLYCKYIQYIESETGLLPSRFAHDHKYKK